MKGKNPYPARRVLPPLLSYLFLLLVGCLDYLTGHEMHLGTLYLLVVATASWNLRPRQLVFHALATAVLWSGAEYLSGVHYTKQWLVYWNTFNHLGVVTITATMVSKAKITLDRQQRLIRDLGQSLLKVSQFKELVPVCRLCHSLHLDDHYHLRLDELVQEGTDMESIGTVCPECLAARTARVASIPVESYFTPPAPGSPVDGPPGPPSR